MEISDNEALACLRVLVAIARADGTIHNDERRSLSAALEGFQLPSGVSVDALLEEDVDVEAQLAFIESAEGRAQLYRSAAYMAHADGTCTKEEQVILDRIAEVLGVSLEERSSLDGFFVAARASSPGFFATEPVTDAGDRATRVQRHVLRTAALTAVLGAFPIPGVAIATDLGVIALQLEMVRRIGGLWGREVDAKRARSMLYSLGLGTGARLAIANLAKLIPGWGSAVGATTSFASTYALGTVIDRFFASGAEDVGALRGDLEFATREGRAAYAEAEGDIRTMRSVEPVLEQLAADLRAGRITQADFDERVAAL